MKKSKDGKNDDGTSTISNGSVGLNSHSKQSFKSMAFNERQAQFSKVKFDSTFLHCFCMEYDDFRILQLIFSGFDCICVSWSLFVFLCLIQQSGKSDTPSSEGLAYVLHALFFYFHLIALSISSPCRCMSVYNSYNCNTFHWICKGTDIKIFIVALWIWLLISLFVFFCLKIRGVDDIIFLQLFVNFYFVDSGRRLNQNLWRKDPLKKLERI